MDINETVKSAYVSATVKGLWGLCPSTIGFYNNLAEELSEARNEINNIDPIRTSSTGVPAGEAIELADMIILIMSYFGKRGWNLEDAIRIKMDYNEKRNR
jgi:hypothetical protein